MASSSGSRSRGETSSRRSRSPQSLEERKGRHRNYGGFRENEKDGKDNDRWSSRKMGPGPSRPRDRNGKGGGRSKDGDWKAEKNRDRDHGWSRREDSSQKQNRASEGNIAREHLSKDSLESRLEPRRESPPRRNYEEEDEDEETRQRRIERLKRRRRSAGFDSDDETVTLEDLIAARQKAKDDKRETHRKGKSTKEYDRDERNRNSTSRYDRKEERLDDVRNNRNTREKENDRERRDGINHKNKARRDRDGKRHDVGYTASERWKENGREGSSRNDRGTELSNYDVKRHNGGDHSPSDRDRGTDRSDDRGMSPDARILRRRVPSSSPYGREWKEENQYGHSKGVVDGSLKGEERIEEINNDVTVEESMLSIPLRAGPDEVYDRVAQVGEGTYGQVFKAKSDKTGVTVALKKIRMESEKDGFPITALREVKLLQGLKHENVVRLHEMMLSKHSIYMVFEYLQHDLNGILAQPSITFSPANIKSLAAQLLAGLAYLHKHRILHRDLKCSNLLLNNEGTLKLADFGLARTYVKQTRPSARNETLDYTNRVVTLWYRAPELLFGETSYDDAIDIWGAGCIFLELFLRKPTFQGNDEIHQVQLLFEILGPINKDEWPEAERLPWFDLIRPQRSDEEGQLVKTHKDHLRALIGSEEQVPNDALEVAVALLTYNPKKRVSANEGLSLPYFTLNSPPAEKPAALLQAVQGEWHEFESRKARRDAAAQALQDHVYREKEQQRVRHELVQQPQISIQPYDKTQEPIQDTTMSSDATPTLIIEETLQRKEDREASA